MPTVVVDALAAHLATFPTEGLIFTNVHGDMIRRFNFGTMWGRATKSVGLDGLHFHDLRHYCASLLIRHGESVKTVQAWLGHANATETLDTYSHLWPDSDDHTREAIDLVLTNFLADSLRTGAGVETQTPQVRGLKVDESVGTPGSVAPRRCRHATDGHPSRVLVAEHL